MAAWASISLERYSGIPTQSVGTIIAGLNSYKHCITALGLSIGFICDIGTIHKAPNFLPFMVIKKRNYSAHAVGWCQVLISKDA